MARNQFGGTAADTAEDASGARIPGAVGTVWDGAGSGATQLTDLTDAYGGQLTQLTSDSNGMLPVFHGPDGIERLWVDFGTSRVALTSSDVGDRLKKHLETVDPHGDREAIFDELGAQKGSAYGLATLNELGQVPASQIPAIAQPPRMVDWLNVKASTYGALGDGIADDTTAIQTAINQAGIGGVVYLPKGVYAISAPLDLPKGVILMGSHSNLMLGPGMSIEDFPCYIQALPTFSGPAMITIIGDADGVHPAINGEQRIINLMLDGSKLSTGTSDGIRGTGNVQNVVMRDVCIRQVCGNGVATAPNANNEWPYSWRLHSVMADNCLLDGYKFQQQTDLSMYDCQAIGCRGVGFYITNCANTQLMGCRAEWTGSHGYHFTGEWGNWPGSGGLSMSGCSTDRCGMDGVRIDATGNGPFLITGLTTRRDGRNNGPGGGGYAGLSLRNRVPVVVSGLTCYVGTDDGGTANTSPQYGVMVSWARDVILNSAYLHAATTPIFEEGTNDRIVYGTGIITNIGNNYSEDRALRA
ncbi:glycosyl hydrolase family 28-related protein [Streptomyces sp. NPDC052179]|uniref:glycosyl hydrolase family 28-related protein n=1 Tax=Streptomyces sp. NPDC052179 TaxID=3155680 RepID=UPI0034172687